MNRAEFGEKIARQISAFRDELGTEEQWLGLLACVCLEKMMDGADEDENSITITDHNTGIVWTCEYTIRITEREG